MRLHLQNSMFKSRLYVALLVLICVSAVDVSRAEESTAYLDSVSATSNAPGAKEPAAVPPPQVPGNINPPVTVSSDVTYVSQYVWHGLDYSFHKPTVQPEAILNFLKVSGIIWINYDIETYRAIDEYDLTLQYSDKFGRAGILSGYTYFIYPHRGWPDSAEVWVQGSYDNFLNPALSAHYDFKSGKGWYYQLGISHSFASPVGNLIPSAILYYYDHYYEITGFPPIEFDLADTISIGKVTASPKISYFQALREAGFKDRGNQFLYSFNLAWSFP